ncbi:unnamed protein product [Arabis nemorensis]|uniref:HTH La-type RNA-binding domain-containing protein n=1 Tax=Arabis nemorensis TaxID=586526 RepID=A0A565CXL6_9BRAS|nr:unnamed protein product [Arabis nemorensis]
MEKEKSDNSGLIQGNAEKKPTKKASSSDSLKSLGDGSSSSSVPVSQSHGSTQNQYQRNSYKNQTGNHHPSQSRNQEHGNHNWNLHRNFNGQVGFAQPPRSGFAQPPLGIPGFVQHAPPPPMPPHFYPFSGPMVFPEWASLPMYHPHHMPFIESPPYVFLVQNSSSKASQFQDSSLETKIRNQVHYYFSEENLRHDEFLRKRMNDEGFVNIQFIAGFKKLKALTSNIELILDALQGSDVVELKGYEIRKRYKWRKFLMHIDLRTPFYPSPECEMTSRVQNMSFEPKADDLESSSSNP